MSNWKSIDIRCQVCDYQWDELVARAEQDSEKFECPDCGAHAGKKTLSAPLVLKASYPDGKKRFTDMKEINALRRERADSKENTRKEINKELRKLKGKTDE